MVRDYLKFSDEQIIVGKGRRVSKNHRYCIRRILKPISANTGRGLGNANKIACLRVVQIIRELLKRSESVVGPSIIRSDLAAKMQAFTQVLLALSLGAFASAQDTYWRHLLTTFGPIPGLGNAFAAQPRTLTELTDEGWVQISSCADNNPKYLP